MTTPQSEYADTLNHILELPDTFREEYNHLIHTLYIRQDFESCLDLIEVALDNSHGLSEFAVFMKALIYRHQGKIDESLNLFRNATILNPHSVKNIKQVGRSLYLGGKHRSAIEVFLEAHGLGIDDWELWYYIGQSFMYLKSYEKAIEAFTTSINHEPHDCCYLQLGKCYFLIGDFKKASQIYRDALDFSPDNPKLLATLGITYLRLGNNSKAFEYLGNSLTLDPRDPKAILAAGSLIQDNSDVDVALVKYRLAIKSMPTSAHLWNNIGMCFFGKGDTLAAIVCLKRALYFAPFEWIIAYNLGLVYVNTGQFASAFHYLSACLNIKRDYAPAFMYLGLVLGRLNDFDNSRAAYDRSIELNDDWMTRLNYAATLLNFSQIDESREQFAMFEAAYESVPESEKDDPEVEILRSKMKSLLL
ncbi:hypothetical protein RCL1_003425 [Eukaryota sp. TZLM3-RCL]